MNSTFSCNLFAAARHLLADRRIHEALEAYDAAQAQGYPTKECAAGRWNCWMLLGEFERAWLESDAIEANCVRDKSTLWDHLPFDGRRVIVRTLHGLGDAIQFIRYVPMLRRRARTVLVETHPALTSIMADLEGVDEILTWPEGPVTWKRYDQQIEVMELPWAFRTKVETIPNSLPYLKRNLDEVKASKNRLQIAAGLNVGLIWASGPYDFSRTMTLKELIPILEIKNVNFYSFQHGPGRTQLAHLAPRFSVRDTVTLSNSVAETAADLLNMDLVISCDTFGAHLAAAMSRPVWLMLPHAADWRWMLSDTSPWYPSMRLFRQPAPLDWRSVIKRISQELRQSLHNFGCPSSTSTDRH
jgi:hypothetical protein